MKADESIDCYGLLCPMPIVETNKKVNEMKTGQILEILSTDQGIKEDMPAWCHVTGNEFLEVEEDGNELKVYIRKLA